MMDSYAVIGLGRFGSAVALELMASGCEVLVIDIHEENVQHIADQVTDAVVADARDEAVLRNLDIQNYDCAIVSIGDDVAASILITLMLKELGIRQVACKAGDEVHKKALLKVGADRVVIPEKEMAGRFAQSLAKPNVVDYIEISDQFAIIEMEVPKLWVGKSLKELNVRAKYGVSVIAFRRSGQMVLSPHPEEQMKSNEILVLLGHEDRLAKLCKL